METREEIEHKRYTIAQDMLAIRSMRRGTITEQFLKAKSKGEQPPVLRGPYYVFSRREGQRTISERLTTPAQVDQTRQDIAEYKKFQDLCKEFEALTERLGVLERQDRPTPEKKGGSRLPPW